MFRKDKKYWLWSAWATREETINFLIKKVAELEKSLSTFPEKEKRHNNDFKKPCPACSGTGVIDTKTERGNEVCNYCNGQGFSKS